MEGYTGAVERRLIARNIRLALALILIGAPGGANAETARAFVERAYRGYSNADFNPLAHPEKYFAQPLAKEIHLDSAGGEVGYLDGDPLCDCQDVSGLKARVESVRMHGKRSADARIMLDAGTTDARSVSLYLVLTDQGWRVADVATKEEPSLLTALMRSNRHR